MSDQSEIGAKVARRSHSPGQGAEITDGYGGARGATGAIARALQRKAAEVGVRRMPRQARGAATFNAILDATGLLLDQAGPEAITTNLVAEVAGVNIATLYQYFPSKESILLALFQRDTDARIRASDEMLAGLGENDDWRSQMAALTDEMVRLRRAQPGAGPLRRAMRAAPELLAYDREGIMRSVRTLAAELVKRGHADATRAELASRCVLEVATALLDVRGLGYAGDIDGQDDLLIAEHKAIVIGYLAPFLDPRPAAVDR